MWIEWSMLWVSVANCLGIPAAHFGISWLFTGMPEHWFNPNHFPYRPWPGESSGIYRKVFRIKSWKSHLPDAAGWFGGFEKKRLRRKDHAYYDKFRRETCRGEAAHWAQWIVISLFIAWTPWPWALIIPVHATLSNLPCILLQRENRLRFTKLLRKSLPNHSMQPDHDHP